MILTSDNPRTEDPEFILDDIEAGMRGKNHERIEDRRAAIARAMAIARPATWCCSRGRATRPTRSAVRRRYPFDEREIVREIAAEGVTLR